MQRHVTGAVPLIGCSAPVLVAVVGVVGVFWAWVVFRLGSLWHLMLWFLRNVARNSPTCISNIEIASLEFCGFLDTYEKLGYPNYVRVLVDEAPEANSCVRSSSHDTVHDPRDSSPSRISRTALQDEPALLTTHPHSHQAQLLQPAMGRHIRSGQGTMRHVGASQRLKCCNLNHRAGPDPMPTPPPTPHNAKSRLTP